MRFYLKTSLHLKQTKSETESLYLVVYMSTFADVVWRENLNFYSYRRSVSMVVIG